MTHMIREEYLHVEVVGTEADGLLVQRRLPAVCHEALARAIEQVLDRGTPPQDSVYIERLEIDAGTLSMDRLEQDLPETVGRALERSLREQISVGGTSPSPEPDGIRIQTDHQRIRDAFIYFLRNGSLPWWFRLPAGRSLEQVLLVSWQQRRKSDPNAVAVRDAVRPVLDTAAVRRRLVRQFSPLFLDTLVSLLSPGSEAVVAGAMKRLGGSAASSVWAANSERVLWETYLAHMAVGRTVTSADLIEETARACAIGDTSPAVSARLSTPDWPDAANKAPADRLPPSKPIPPLRPPSQKCPVEREPNPEAREGLYVENAGLVLLHPFLVQLFSALGVSDEDTLVQPDRALSLLHFMATGRTDAPEYELVLPKILCHVPLDMPPESQVDLTIAEQDEAVALLESVIRHWQVLRNTSPDGLREAFLLRPGKVSVRDDGDGVVQIESRTHDILLDQLPWGLSMIKLPWMRNMLRVDWR
jgi:hypothetical protein